MYHGNPAKEGEEGWEMKMFHSGPMRASGRLQGKGCMVGADIIRPGTQFCIATSFGAPRSSRPTKGRRTTENVATRFREAEMFYVEQYVDAGITSLTRKR